MHSYNPSTIASTIQMNLGNNRKIDSFHFIWLTKHQYVCSNGSSVTIAAVYHLPDIYTTYKHFKHATGGINMTAPRILDKSLIVPKVASP